MCIFFLSTECSFAGLHSTMPLSVLFNSSRRPSTGEATSSAPSFMSSRSSVTTISSRSNGSSDSLNEMFCKESNKAPTSDHPIKHFHISTSSEADFATVSLTAEDSAVSDCITAINVLTNTLESKSGVEIGRCLDPTTPVPSKCKNFQIRHRSSFKRQTGYFDKCVKCTDVGRQWQQSRNEEEITWEQLRETGSNGQQLKKAVTGMCSAQGCDECRPKKT